MADGAANRSRVLDRYPWLVPVAIVAVAAGLMVTIFLSQRGGGEEPEAVPPAEVSDNGDQGPADVVQPEQPDLSSIEERDPDDALSAGPVDAPVALVVFSDYQCPFCASWSHETLPEMMGHVEAGDLYIEWRDVNIFGPASERASRASYAAALQGQFWEYHDALFPDGEIRDEADLSEEALISLAGELGLDVEQFTADLASDEVGERIQANAEAGLEIGVHSTPAFILGGEPIVGAQPTEVFVQAMDEALARAGR